MATYNISRCLLSGVNSKRSIYQKLPICEQFCNYYCARTRPIRNLTVQQGLFHVDLPELQSEVCSKPDDPGSYQSKLKKDGNVHYLYYKEMVSASTYLQREREKLLSQPRTEKEFYHAKHTPRLFYLDREEYQLTASCLPRTETIYEENDVSQEEFLNRVGKEKNTFFPIHFLMDGLSCLGKRSDEWLIDLNNDARFLRFCILLRAMCDRMSNEELADVLKFLARAQVRTRSSALPALYEECCSRVPHLTLELGLLMLDSWRMIGFPIPQFYDLVFSQCLEKIPSLTTSKLIQLIYLTGENRGAPDGVENALVQALPDHLDSLTLTELGTVCTGLFKSFTSPSTGDIMMQISDHVCSSDIQTVHSFFIVGILKHFRRQYHGYQHFFNYVANAVTPLLKFYPLMSCMQILLTYATMHICHPSLCDAIATEVIDHADQWRSKDATKIMWSYGTLQYIPEYPDFMSTIVNKFINLQGDVEEYPVNLVTSLLSLAYLQLYPWELINRLFSPEFMHIAADYMKKTGFDLRRDMLLLDRALDIECPEYDGNRLSESFMLGSDINTSIAPTISQQLSSRPELKFVEGLVNAVLGRKEYYRVHPILPHLNTIDIEVRLDGNDPIPFNDHDSVSNFCDDQVNSQTSRTPNNSRSVHKGRNAVAISSDLISHLTRGVNNADRADEESITKLDTDRPTKTGSGNLTADPLWNVKRILQKPVPAPTNSRERWLAIVVWARNHSHYGGSKLLGQHAMKRRQLELLGYQVVDVPFQDWTRLMKSRGHQESIKFMRRKIFNGATST